MNLEVLVSTMNRNDVDLVDKMNIKSDVLIINQSSSLFENVESSNDFRIRMLTFSEQGLSKSRNRALANAKGDVCLIADDDVVYNDNYVDLVIKAHKENKEYDVIAFQVPTTNKDRSKYYRSTRMKIGYANSMKVASFEISFKRKSIIDNNIQFDENFGAGSKKYLMGEENIFLYECLKKGLKILYLPIDIGIVTHEESTWLSKRDKNYFISKGACFTALSNKFSTLLILQFAFRKQKLYKKDISVKKAIQYMFEGRKRYILETNGK